MLHQSSVNLKVLLSRHFNIGNETNKVIHFPRFGHMFTGTFVNVYRPITG